MRSTIIRIITILSLSNIVASAVDCKKYSWEGSRIFQEAGVEQQYYKAYDCLDTYSLSNIHYRDQNNHNQYLDAKPWGDIYSAACYTEHGMGCIDLVDGKNIQDKLNFLNKAVEYKEWQAYYHLGNLYFERKKYQTAIQMYQKACDHQVKDGCIALAHIYHDGIYAMRSMLLADQYARQAGFANYSKIIFIIQ